MPDNTKITHPVALDATLQNVATNIRGLSQTLTPAVDANMSTVSTNPVQNKVVTAAVNDKVSTVSMTKQDDGTRKLTFTKGNGTTSEYDLSYPVANGTNPGLESSAHYTKLEGIAAGAEVNQNAFSSFAGENGELISATSKQDSIEIHGVNIDIDFNPGGEGLPKVITFTGNTGGGEDWNVALDGTVDYSKPTSNYLEIYHENFPYTDEHPEELTFSINQYDLLTNFNDIDINEGGSDVSQIQIHKGCWTHGGTSALEAFYRYNFKHSHLCPYNNKEYSFYYYAYKNNTGYRYEIWTDNGSLIFNATENKFYVASYGGETYEASLSGDYPDAFVYDKIGTRYTYNGNFNIDNGSLFIYNPSASADVSGINALYNYYSESFPTFKLVTDFKKGVMYDYYFYIPYYYPTLSYMLNDQIDMDGNTVHAEFVVKGGAETPSTGDEVLVKRNFYRGAPLVIAINDEGYSPEYITYTSDFLSKINIYADEQQNYIYQWFEDDSRVAGSYELSMHIEYPKFDPYNYLTKDEAANTYLNKNDVDANMSTVSTNPVQNAVVTAAVNNNISTVSMTKSNDGTRKLTFEKGNGSTFEHDLSYTQATDSVLGLVKVNGSTGTSTTDVMSQKAVTDELSAIKNITDNFTIENGELCILVDEQNNGGSSNGTVSKAISLNETLQDIADTLDGMSDNIDSVAASTAAETTTNWLNEHVDPQSQTIIDDSLTISGAAADAKVTGDNVRELKSALNVTTKATARALDFTTSADFTKVNGSASVRSNNNGILVNTSGTSGSTYYTYYKQITEDADIYFNNIGSSVYFTLCVAVNCTNVTVGSSNIIFEASSSSVRYRAQDSNLPTSESPLTVHNGDYILITVEQSDTTHKTIYGLDGYDYDYSDRLKNDLLSRTIKRNACIYDDTASGDITEKLTIYLMAKGGYTKVPFCHSINDDSKLCDVWNIQPLYAVDDSFTDRFQISTTGEFECALKIDGASDFIGGTAHGDEYATLITVLIDGHNVDISDLTTLTEFDELKIVVNSNLISPFDHTTLVATHAKEYVFKGDEITINQVVEWKTAQTMDQSYMAMFPVAKAITPKVITDKKYEVRTLSVSGYFNETGTKKAISFSNDFVGTFGIGNWSIKGTSLTGVGKYVITDNSGHPYNKQYFCCCASGVVADGDLWSTTTYYKFEH